MVVVQFGLPSRFGVILSAAGTKRSGVPAKSKDPYTFSISEV
jgi:hypothetical protein